MTSKGNGLNESHAGEPVIVDGGRRVFRHEIVEQLEALPPTGWEDTELEAEWREWLDCRSDFLREVLADQDSRPQSRHLTLAGWHLLGSGEALREMMPPVEEVRRH